MEKSANKRWKESGTTLSFKDWIDIENKKEESKKNYLSFSIPKPSDFLKDTIAQNKESVVTSQYKPEEDKTKGEKTKADKKEILLPKPKYLNFR